MRELERTSEQKRGSGGPQLVISGGANRYRYQGKERDLETGLDYYGYRYLCSWLGRWTCPDPGGTVDGLNLMSFVGGGPVGKRDVDGRFGDPMMIDGRLVSDARNEIKANAESSEPAPVGADLTASEWRDAFAEAEAQGWSRSAIREFIALGEAYDVASKDFLVFRAVVYHGAYLYHRDESPVLAMDYYLSGIADTMVAGFFAGRSNEGTALNVALEVVGAGFFGDANRVRHVDVSAGDALRAEVRSTPYGRYDDVRADTRGSSPQAHHVQQNAAFEGGIQRGDGISVGLEGNVFRDVGSPHHSAHVELEAFWDQYRRDGALFGETPTIAQYNSAARQSLVRAGLSEDMADIVMTAVHSQQRAVGLDTSDLVPAIPNPFYFRGRNGN